MNQWFLKEFKAGLQLFTFCLIQMRFFFYSLRFAACVASLQQQFLTAVLHNLELVVHPASVSLVTAVTRMPPG